VASGGACRCFIRDEPMSRRNNVVVIVVVVIIMICRTIRAEAKIKASLGSSTRRGTAVATPGRLSYSSTPKFMPKKKGRIGF
jgi:hypothetical protein